ncbi:MAG: alpha-ketoglutarate-dependent dioxygenase AlkB [Gammaproteobacteria bacterium]|nr:alpha-ketoglutarate-dependent dioxygenase AlkB [Gammaproteobacteria bacterium]
MTYSPPTGLARAGRDLGITETLYVPGFLTPRQADAMLDEVIDAANWQQERFPMFGRLVVAPRLTAWYGEPGATYRYSGVDRRAGTWLPPIRGLAAEVSKAVGWRFNYVLVNRYRDGRDMLGWHADDEADLGEAPVLAAISVGSERVFRMRPRGGGASTATVLGHGSLLVMWGNSQRDYKHCLPGTRQPVGERLSFTFRRTREMVEDAVQPVRT